MKKILVEMEAYTRVRCFKVLEVPDDFTDEDVELAACRVQDAVDGGEYADDEYYWDEGEVDWRPWEKDDPADYRAYRDGDDDVGVEEQ
jgi:hypothetical protein